MSIYISIDEVVLLQKPSRIVCFVIQSKEAVLRTTQQPASTSPVWHESLICSTKDAALNLGVLQPEDDKLIGEGILNFLHTGIYASPKRSIRYKLDLHNNSQIVGTVVLKIYFDNLKKYLGEIQFYEIDEALESRKSSILIDQSDREREGKPVPHKFLEFYKGPCKSKNIFSFLDASILSQSFHAFEKQYR